MELAKIFPKRPFLIGMIHMFGETHSERVGRALNELDSYQRLEIDGAIIENYSREATIEDMETVLGMTKATLKIGINVLPNEVAEAYRLASKYGCSFIQLDHVAGVYREGKLDVRLYNELRAAHPDIAVLGGVHPKYYHPIDRATLETDILEGAKRADAIVVTGEATGVETPTSRVKHFRNVLDCNPETKNIPLIVGAGLKLHNICEQFGVAHGGVVGSGFKYVNRPELELAIDQIGAYRNTVRWMRTQKIDVTKSMF